MIFLAVLMFGLVSAETNTSIMYGENSSGSIVPLQIDDDGQLKISLSFMNITVGSISATGNLSLGEKITFGFGEAIDNIVDGWVRVTGALNVTSGNFSLGGKLLSNEGGVLTWGGTEVTTNVSVLYAENSSGSPTTLKIDDTGSLKMHVSSVVSNVWQIVGGITQLVNAGNVNISGNLNVSGMIIGEANGVGIGSDISTDDNYTLTSADRNRLVILNGSAGGHTNFTLPAGTDGEIYRILNDAEYTLTIKPTGTDAVWNSGNGYGIDLPDKGTMVELRYSSSRGKWDILQKTGGKVLIEGLVLHEPMNQLNVFESSASTYSSINDKTVRHAGTGLADLQVLNDPNAYKFSPACFIFDGTGDYIEYRDSPDWDIFGTQTGHKTVAGWIYTTTVGATSDAICGTKIDGSNYWTLYRTVDTFRLIYVYAGGANIDIATAAASLSVNTWHHVAMILSGADIGLYIDGVQLQYSATWTGGLETTSPFYVGADTDAINTWTGRMQDLHISYNNPYGANPNSGSTDSFTLPAAPFVGVMN